MNLLGNLPDDWKALITSQLQSSYSSSSLSRIIGGTIRITELWIIDSQHGDGRPGGRQGMVVCEMQMSDELRDKLGGLDMAILSGIVDL